VRRQQHPCLPTRLGPTRQGPLALGRIRDHARNAVFRAGVARVTHLARAPGPLAALLMIPAQALLHVPLPTVSGQAVLTMPILAPLCDLLGISRDAAVIAYQTGAGLMDMITPTNGALLAMVLGARVGYDRWLRFAVPGAVLVALVGAGGILLAQ